MQLQLYVSVTNCIENCIYKKFPNPTELQIFLICLEPYKMDPFFVRSKTVNKRDYGTITAVLLVFNPFSQFVPQLELYS